MDLISRIRGIFTTHGRCPVERRAEARLDSCLDATLWIEGASIQGFTKNISASGVKLELADPRELRIGDEFRIKIDVPQSIRPVEALACVVRVDKSAPPILAPGIAFHFDRIGADHQQAIRDFVYRREHERLRFDIPEAAPITLTIGIDGEEVPAFAHDISAGGARLSVVTAHCFQIEACYWMELHLPAEKHDMRVLARLLRIHAQPTEPGESGTWQLALRFTEIKPADQARIDAFVHAHKRGPSQ